MHFFDIIIKPAPTMQEALKKVDVGQARKYYAIYGAIIGFIFGAVVAVIGTAVAALFGGATQNNPLLGIVVGLGVLSIIVLPIVFALITVIGAHVWYWVVWKIATAFGGSGTFENNYFLSAKLLFPSLAASIIVSILGIVPLLGALLNFAWVLYSIYLLVILISVANSLSKWKALAILIIPFIFVFLLSLILGVGIGLVALGR